jgi:hypothetical protein
MSYTKAKPNALGATFGSVVEAASAVAQDPCLYKVTDLVLQLRDLETAPPAKKLTSLGLPARKPARGIGLCHAVKPLEVALYLRKKPWVLPVAGTATVAGLILLGWWIGRSK